MAGLGPRLTIERVMVGNSPPKAGRALALLGNDNIIAIGFLGRTPLAVAQGPARDPERERGKGGARATGERTVRPEPIKVAVERVLEDLRSGKRLRGGQVLDVWPEIAGKRIAQHTRPVMIRNGRLLVNVDRSVWLYELSQRYKVRLLKRLQKRLGKDAVGDIQFRMGEV